MLNAGSSRELFPGGLSRGPGGFCLARLSSRDTQAAIQDDTVGKVELSHQQNTRSLDFARDDSVGWKLVRRLITFSGTLLDTPTFHTANL